MLPVLAPSPLSLRHTAPRSRRNVAGAKPASQSGTVVVVSGGSFVIVETTVSTTVGQIDAVWGRLNEYDINAKLASKCLPPAVLKYGDMKTPSFSWSTERTLFLVLGITIPFIVCFCIPMLCLKYDKCPF